MTAQATAIRPCLSPDQSRAQKGAVDCATCSIRLVSVCAALEGEELAVLESKARPACFAAKDSLFLEGEPADAVYNITSGTVRLYRIFGDGRRQIIGFMLPGDFLGLDMARRHVFGAEAIGAVTVCRFPRRDFAELVQAKPHLLSMLHSRATQQLLLAQDQAMTLGRRSADERVAWFIIQMRDRWMRIGQVSPEIPLPMSRQDIADYLGLSIETVSRTVARFARDKTLRVRRRSVRILDEGRLAELAAA